MTKVYCAMGDSMSIDDYAGGPGHGAASLLADDLGMELRMVARDGATSTVYDPTDGTGDLTSANLPAWEGGLDVLSAVNLSIRRAAERHGAVVADVHQAFLGHGLTAGDVGQPDPRPANKDLWFCGHVEPNAWGAMAIRDAWRAALRPPA